MAGPRRREVLRAAGLAGLAGFAGTSLGACARDVPRSTGAQRGAGLTIASPQNPVTWPIADDNPAIADGLEPERNATLQIYNYADYLDPAAMKGFERKYRKYGVKVRLSTFNDQNEALAKIRAGTVPFDIYLPSYDAIGKLVVAGLLRPLNHGYIPNIRNVWPEFTNPFYDGQWHYTVPYMIYTTGIGWRTDTVSEDIGARDTPWDAFWDPRYASRISVLDDYRETPAMTLLRQGASDVNTGDPEALAKVQADLLALAKATRPKVTVNQYSDLPEGRLDVCLAWSGDLVNAPYYLPKGKDASILRYWFPTDGKGVVNNDLMAVLRSGKNPVLAHLFLDYMLDPDVALANLGATGYQPPQNTLTADTLVAEEYIPENLKTATVRQEDFSTGYRTLELPPDVDGRWQALWQRFNAGA
jgi:spermidine/putrescine transport system substrate-binding protein